MQSHWAFQYLLSQVAACQVHSSLLSQFWLVHPNQTNTWSCKRNQVRAVISLLFWDSYFISTVSFQTCFFFSWTLTFDLKFGLPCQNVGPPPPIYPYGSNITYRIWMAKFTSLRTFYRVSTLFSVLRKHSAFSAAMNRDTQVRCVDLTGKYLILQTNNSCYSVSYYSFVNIAAGVSTAVKEIPKWNYNHFRIYSELVSLLKLMWFKAHRNPGVI